MAEAVGLIAGFNDVAVMGEPVQQCRGHLGITEDSGPLGKRQVGGDQNAGVLIEFGQQMEQQCSTDLAEWQVPIRAVDDVVTAAFDRILSDCTSISAVTGLDRVLKSEEAD